MERIFYSNIIDLLKKSDIRFRETEVRNVTYDNDTVCSTLHISDCFNYGPTKLSKTPVVSCLIVFTLYVDLGQ